MIFNTPLPLTATELLNQRAGRAGGCGGRDDEDDVDASDAAVAAANSRFSTALLSLRVSRCSVAANDDCMSIDDDG